MENFKCISRVFPNEGHYDVALPALVEAIELIFPKDKWFAKYRNIVNKSGNALNNLDHHFQELSSEYGFKILPKAERWNSVNRLSWIGTYLLKQGRTSEAIEVIERWVRYRPKSTLALSELAKTYEASGKDDLALSTLEKAYKISLSTKTDEANEYLHQIKQLKLRMLNRNNN